MKTITPHDNDLGEISPTSHDKCELIINHSEHISSSSWQMVYYGIHMYEKWLVHISFKWNRRLCFELGTGMEDDAY